MEEITYNGKVYKFKKEGVYKNDKELLCTDIKYVNRKTLGFSPVRGYSSPEGYFIVKGKNPISNSYMTLADIMEDEVDEKYFLSDEQVERLMRRQK